MNLVTFTEDKEKEYGTIYLNRPEKRNAISLEMAQQLSQLLEEIKHLPLKFLVIKSAGETVFCAGGDLNDFHGSLNEKEAYDTLHTMKHVLSQIIAFPVPTIALLQGDALGGGCELATACDIRIAKDTAKFGFVQSNLGILPGWGGGAILYEKVPASFALQWLTEGNMLAASSLQQKGWIQKVVQSDEWIDETEVLEAYTKKSIAQMEYLKTQYMEALSIPTLLEKMDKESARCASLWNSPEHEAIVSSFLHKS